MSERADGRPTTEQLLAAYASGALRGAEAAEVEELLARDPAARAELDALRSTLAAVRTVEPRPAVEPDWEQMARDIRAACAERPRPGLLARLRDALRPRHAVFGLAVAGAAAALIVMLMRRQPAEQTAVAPPPDAAVPAPTVAEDDLRIPEVEDLDDDELDDLDVALGPDSVALADPDQELDAEDVAAWAASGESVALAVGDLDLGLFEESGYDDMLGALSEEELDALEAALVDG